MLYISTHKHVSVFTTVIKNIFKTCVCVGPPGKGNFCPGYYYYHYCVNHVVYTFTTHGLLNLAIRSFNFFVPCSGFKRRSQSVKFDREKGDMHLCIYNLLLLVNELDFSRQRYELFFLRKC